MSTVSAFVPFPFGRLVGVGAVVFLANAALLVLQLVAGRLLAPFIGSSLETWTSIIGVFLAGIALGNAYGGKLADRYPTPKTLAILLGAGAVAALWMMAFPQLLASTGAHKSLPLGPRIPILAAALCLPAGFVLSLLTPLAIKLGLPDVAHTGRVAGLIFALSTLGCLLGNYVTGFYLIPTFTINTLVLVAAGSLAALAVVALVIPKPELNIFQEQQLAPVENAPHEERTVQKSQVGWGKPLLVTLGVWIGMVALNFATGSFLPAWAVLFATALWAAVDSAKLEVHKYEGRWSGPFWVFVAVVGVWVFLFPAYLVTRSRLLAGELRLKKHHRPDGFSAGQNDGTFKPHTFPDIRHAYLIVFLASFCGMTLELTASRMLAQVLGVSLFTWTGIIGVMLAGTALGNFVGGLIADGASRAELNPRHLLAWTLCGAGGAVVVALLLFSLLSRYWSLEELGAIAQVIAWTFSLFFLPMFLLGLVSPQVIRLAVPDVAHAGSVAGRVYAWSTAGAIVGTFAAGYFLLSTFGVRNTLLLAGLVLVGTSLLVTKVWENNSLLYLFSIVLGGIVGGFILGIRSSSEEGLVVVVESNYYTIKVTHSGNEGVRKLTLDHLVHSSVDLDHPEYLYYTHEHIQMEFLQLARVGAAEPKALVIGGGGYTFPRYAMELMPESRVDVVEIDPKVTEVAHEHLGLRKDYPGLRAIHMDGRQYVAEKVPPGTYDLVIQDAVNDLSVPAHLMTKEYNDAVKKSLKGDGVYLLTIIDSIAYGKLWKAAMATLAQTFPAENVVLLTAEEPPLDPIDLNKWNQQRRVLVIYASDKPFSLGAVVNAVPGAAARLGTLPLGPIDLPGTGPTAALHMALATRVSVVHTVPIQAKHLKDFTDREPGVILTDQFCPVDNLMAEVFRQRYK